MKKPLLALIALATLVSVGSAFAGGHPGGGPNKLARMQEHLNLSDAQVEQIRAIHEQGGGREEVRDVLTEEQQQLAREMRGKRKGEHRPPPQNEE